MLKGQVMRETDLNELIKRAATYLLCCVLWLIWGMYIQHGIELTKREYIENLAYEATNAAITCNLSLMDAREILLNQSFCAPEAHCNNCH